MKALPLFAVLLSAVVYADLALSQTTPASPPEENTARKGSGFLGLGGEPQRKAAAKPSPTQADAGVGPVAKPDIQARPTSFPLLVDCEQGLAGLRFGSREETIAYLDRRIGFWRVQGLSTIEPFVHPAQAEYALDCFNIRINFLAAYLPQNDARRAASAAAKAISQRWNVTALNEFITGNTPASRAPTWWAEADAAFSEVAKLEIAISRAIKTPTPERDALLVAAQTALGGFELTIDQVLGFQDSLDAAGRAFWLRALSWRARGAGLAIDTLQRWDFDRDPDGAYALIVRGTAEEPPSAERDIAGDLAPFIARLKGLRRDREVVDPGTPRDWTIAGLRRMALEGLYLTNFMSASLEDRIGDWQREEEVSKRLDLELGFDIALARGAPEAESRAAVEVSLQAFRAQQQETRREAIARTRDALAADRMRTVFQGPFLGGVR